MNGLLIIGLEIAWVALLGGSFLGWQLLRQNGRMLRPLEALEKRLDELEYGGEQQTAGLPLDSAVPDFELPDLAGNRHSLAQYRGQKLLPIFFNSACGFCRELAPKPVSTRGGRREVEGLGGAEKQTLNVEPRTWP